MNETTWKWLQVLAWTVAAVVIYLNAGMLSDAALVDRLTKVEAMVQQEMLGYQVVMGAIGQRIDRIEKQLDRIEMRVDEMAKRR